MLNERWPVVFFHKFIHCTDIFKMITPQLCLVYVSHPQTCQHPLQTQSQVSAQTSEGNTFQPVGGAFSSNPLVVSSAKTLVHLLIIALITHNLPLVYLQTSLYIWTSLVAQTVKRLLTMQATRVQSLGREDLLEKGMATHPNILAWKIPWMEEPGRLESMGVSKNRT